MLLRRIIVAGLVAVVGAGCGGCGDDGGFADARPIDAPIPGTVSLSWSLRDLFDQSIDCDQVGPNATIRLELTPKGGGRGEVESLSCQNNPSMSRLLPPGLFTVTYELRAPNLTPATATAETDVEIMSGRNTPLKPIVFQIDVRGSVVLSFTAPPATSNCKPASMMGAGITGHTITLMARGACAPITFTRKRGTTTVGTYTVNCGSPAVAPCIETDETLTGTSISSGSYTISVRGKIGAVDCWGTDNQLLRIPPQGNAAIETVNLAFKTGTPGC